MPLYVGDYLADTMHLNGAEHGAYLLLLMHHWRNGPLPDDDKSLAAIARTDLVLWAEVGPVVRAFFNRDADGKLVQKRLMEERAKATDISAKREAAGKRGAASRWKDDKPASGGGGPGGANGSKPHGKQMANAIGLPEQTDRPSPSPSPRQKKKEEEGLHTPVSTRARVPAEAAAGASQPFEQFWNAYPKREGGEPATRRAYDAAIRGGATHAELMAALGRVRWPSNPRFIPYPKNCYRDEPAAPHFDNPFMQLEYEDRLAALTLEGPHDVN
jgi:uncharacterized protein YdaU (DUF1376 family)